MLTQEIQRKYLPSSQPLSCRLMHEKSKAWRPSMIVASLRPADPPVPAKRRDKLYKVWADMKASCDNKDNRSYEYIGGRGVSYCEAWKKYENFKRDMEPLFSLSYIFVRIDVDQDFAPGNCLFVPRAEAWKYRRKATVEYGGEEITIATFCRRTGANRSQAYKLAKQGCTGEEILARRRMSSSPFVF